MQQMIFIADLIACSTCFGTNMPIIRSSRVLHRLLLPLVFGALAFKFSVWCGAECYVSGLRAAAQQPANRTHNPQLHTIPTT